MPSILQVLKVSEVRKGVGAESKKPYEIQDADCILLNDDGTPNAVGTWMVSKELTGKLQPGTYTASFSLVVGQGKENRGRIGAVITGLTLVPARGAK